MRIYLPTTGETRIVRKFALFPIAINAEIRWLEMVTIYQSYNTRHKGWNNDYFETK